MLEQTLLEKKLITQEQLSIAQNAAKSSGEHISQALLRLGLISESTLLRAVAEFLGLEYVDLSQISIDQNTINSVPAKIAMRKKLLPIKRTNGTLVIATSDPLNLKAVDELRVLLDCDVQPVVGNSNEIDRLLKKYYGIGAESMDQLLQESGQNLEVLPGAGEENGESLEMVEDASLVQFVNQIILEAVRDRASDIHIEPFEDELRVRYRIDGILHSAVTPPKIKLFQHAIISRIKIMAELNIAEKRLPQDGRIKLRAGDKEIDVRVSIIPGIHGESVVLRLLDRSAIFLGLEDLGMDEQSYAGFRKLIDRPHGIILVTGPTGSGKSTTLYAALAEINSDDKKIITIEDPVEYQLKGILQIPTKPKIGFDFAQGLRSILRHDPDIIMVGEIRDRDTADIAIRSALTGHLVFSTLHTNDAASSITRLIDMGIEPYLVASSVEGIMAQRLVRRICEHCKEEQIVDRKDIEEYFAQYQTNRVYRGKGCEFCKKTGYRGRMGIFELLLVDDDIRDMIVHHATAGQIKRQALTKNMKTLRDDGWQKVCAGLTTIEEVLRVTKEE
ncbi:MAG: type II secretion system ATPase GspE [bacterium]|nr:type II secretion system ATPase GspE [bacterium]